MVEGAEKMEVDGGAGRPSRSVYEMLSDIRVGMEEVAAKMLFIKKEGRSKSELRELVTQMSLLFIALRQANRAILLEEDRVKAETEKAKGPVDFTTLQLHNLIYEKNHYLKAIKACKDFRSKYPDIELVPEGEFFHDAPEDIKRNVLSSDGQHDLMLKRLNYEHFQRKELCKLCDKLEQHKKGLLDTIATRKKFLSSLPSHLKSLKKASFSLQHQLGMPHTKKLKQHRAAELLPPPLYIVYTQFLSQKEAFEEKIELEIIGSIKDAQTFVLQPKSDNGINISVDNNMMDDDTPDDEDDSQSRRKRPKKVANRDKLENAGLYESHPLNILLHIYDNEESDSSASKLLTLRFQYLVKLKVVCVGIEGADRLTNNILCNLFPDDTGLQLPHQRAKLYAGDSIAFDEKRTMRPYKWAQHLAGMDFLPELSPLYTSSESSKDEASNGNTILSGLSLYRQQNRVETLLQRIRSRKKSHMALVKQLDALMELKWPTLTYRKVPWALHSPVCNLEYFAPIGSETNSISPLAAATEQAMDLVDPNGEDKVTTSKTETENIREDGELPSASQIPLTLDIKLASPKGSFDPEHSRSLALIAKSSTPRMGKSQSFGHNFDELELLLDSESDTEKTHPIQEKDVSDTGSNGFIDNLWEDFSSREYQLILSGEDRGRNVKLQAQIKVFAEYPLRPPLFSLVLVDDISKPESTICKSGGTLWYNELRAIEAEVNLHILRILPREDENFILAHQVHLLAMLFDFHVNQADACPGVTSSSSSVLDVGLCKPVMGKMISRLFRGRDRRKMFSWKDVGCTPGYPY